MMSIVTNILAIAMVWTILGAVIAKLLQEFFRGRDLPKWFESRLDSPILNAITATLMGPAIWFGVWLDRD